MESRDMQAGQVVCLVGSGTDLLFHRHDRIERVTKTLIVTRSGRRYNRQMGHSTPYQPYGGTRIYATCQRPK